MQLKIVHGFKLLDELTKATKQSLDGTGFRKMAELIEEKIGEDISDRFLRETLFEKLNENKKKGVVSVSFRPYKLDKIAEYLGYDNLHHFISRNESMSHPILSGCTGVYYCYIRRNTDKGVILVSPVIIFEKDGEIFFELRGPDRNYMGEVRFANNCLFILMKAKNGKQFHHVYQIGQREKPELLQGIFSGVSTSFDPIGGRVVLKRVKGKYESLSNSSTEVKQMKKSKSLEARRIAEYFEKYEENNLKIKRSITFGLDDLGNCR